MTDSNLITATRDVLNSYYEEGNVRSILNIASDDIVAFGTKSLRYAVGKKAVESLLQHELALVTPCRIVNIKLEEQVVGTGVTVLANVILRITYNVPIIMHQIYFMYSHSMHGYVLTGVHIYKDLHSAAKYRAVGNQVINIKEIPQEIRESTQLKKLVTDNMATAYICWQIEPYYRRFDYNDALWRMLGFESSLEFQDFYDGKSLLCTMAEDERKAVLEHVAAQIEEGKDSFQVEYCLPTKGNKQIYVMECGNFYIAEDGARCCRSIILDVTALRQISEKLNYQIVYDDLTKIYNKKAFCQKAQEMINNFPDKEFEIMQFDIRRFKIINEFFGERTSNEILKYIADFFVQSKMPNCVYGRLHSDHFALCYSTEDDTREKIIKSLRILVTSFSISYRIEVCFGVCPVKERAVPVALMCDCAGLALIKAKKNALLLCGEYTDDMRRDILNEQKIVNKMEDSLENDEFLIYMQPKYDIRNNKIVGSEALIRWVNPQKGCISPDEFIPIFENNGFIYRLDQFVWRKVCQWLRSWIDAGHEPLPVSVNVSRVDLYNPNLKDTMVKMIEEYQLDPSLFELEITESAYMDNPEHIISIVKSLQVYGFKILMDDFGSGYSSLSMLKDLPVDILKLDLSFLANEDKTGRSSNILNSIVRMAQWLGIPVICEGVETSAQVEFLRDIGCEFVQGYYFSRPIPIQHYERMLINLEEKKKKEPKETSWSVNDKFGGEKKVDNIKQKDSMGVAFYEIRGEELIMHYANKWLHSLNGMTETSFVNLTGGKINKVLGKPWEKKMVKLLIDSFEKKESMYYEYPFDSPTGKLYWLVMEATAIIKDNDSYYFFATIKDVTNGHKRTSADDIFKKEE